MTPRRATVLALAALGTAAGADVPPSILEAMEAELARSLRVLSATPEPPYYLSYEITELDRVRVSGSFGVLTDSRARRNRLLDVDLRVGDYRLDNTRSLRGGGFRSGIGYRPTPVPLDDAPEALRAVLWLETDLRYRGAVEQLTRVRSDSQVKVERDDESPDFSREEARRYSEAKLELEVDRAAWEEKVRRYTAPFAEHAEIFVAEATLSAEAETRWLVNSEGSRVQTSQLRYRLSLRALTKADDGMELPRYETSFATEPHRLPDDAEVLATVDRMIRDLLALREAPVVEPYIGPAILSGRAAGVFFHEVFGHRVEGHRQKREEEGQTFKKKIGEPILPAGFNVVFDPTRRRQGVVDLSGFYAFDNQGVAARPVKVVENGVFRRFLMSRSPIEGFDRSNGHGRRQPGFQPVARQSNLIVEVVEPVSTEELRALLIRRLEEEDKPFGLRFEDIQGGFTLTGRTVPNAFNVLPILVYKVYADGSEELVRGVDLIGTPLAAFSQVVAADDQVAVFNGTCGAESGGVPVAAASPALLVAQIEVQKKSKSQERPPILPPPWEDVEEPDLVRSTPHRG